MHPLVPLVKASKQHESKMKILRMLRRGEESEDISGNLTLSKEKTVPLVYSQTMGTSASRPASRALYYTQKTVSDYSRLLSRETDMHNQQHTHLSNIISRH